MTALDPQHPTVTSAARMALLLANTKRLNEALSEKLAAVAKLHRQGDRGGADAAYCKECDHDYPCATARLVADTAVPVGGNPNEH